MVMMSNLSLAIAVAEATGASIATGEIFADGFGTLGMVDEANATGLDTSETGYLKPASTAGSSTVQSFGSPTPGSYATGFTVIDLTTPLTPGDVIVTLGFRHTAAVASTVKIVKRNSAENFDIVVSEAFTHPGGGLAFKTLAAPFVVPETGDYYPAVHNGSDTVRVTAGSRATKSGNVTGTGQSGFSEGMSANMVPMAVQKNPIAAGALPMEVASEIIPVAVQPEAVSGELRVVPTDALTLNDDIVLEVTRGDVWHPVELELAMPPLGGTHVLRFAAVDLSADPSGDEPRWRLSNDPVSPKMFRVTAIGLEFDP
jgi:hypothetical protein